MKIETEILEIRCNLDDQSGEQLAPILEELITLGALDAWFIPIIMKKGRPAMQLNLLCTCSLLEKIEAYIFTHTTGLGFRYHPVTRHTLERRMIEIETQYGKIHIKIGQYEGREVSFAPEYEDCAKLARALKIPLKEVFAEANRIYMNQRSN